MWPQMTKGRRGGAWEVAGGGGEGVGVGEEGEGKEGVED